jgi:beta-glucanase (GH16 family)
MAAALAAGQERKLIWSDEFNTPGAPDPAKWGYESGFVRNEENQFYTEGRRENARVEKGVLVLEARKERWPNPQHQSGAKDWRQSRRETAYTSASVTTQGKAEWTYGRVEVRAKLPTGRGLWPAIWLLGASCPAVGWPLCGEIDIMENVGYDPDVIHANIHTQAYNHVQKTNKGGKITVPAPWRDFHVYAVDWTPERMEFSVDGKVYFRFLNERKGAEVWPFDKPHYLILNIAVGGAWGATKGIDDTVFPQRMEIDWVRVYQNR